MRYRRDDADDAERCVFCQRDAVVAAECLGAQELDARGPFGDDSHLIDLVIQPADAGFFELLPTQLLGLVDADAANTVDGLAAVIETAGPELFLSVGGGLDSAVHVV